MKEFNVKLIMQSRRMGTHPKVMSTILCHFKEQLQSYSAADISVSIFIPNFTKRRYRALTITMRDALS